MNNVDWKTVGRMREKMNQNSGNIYTDDGIRIYWKTVGKGPLLICSNGVGVGTFFWKYICAQYASRFQILMWDYRGHGESDRDSNHVLQDISIRRHAQDLETIYHSLFPHTPCVTLLELNHYSLLLSEIESSQFLEFDY